MHCYETIFILHPDLSDEDVDAAKTRVADIITATGGRIYRRENWGKKRLAYTVLKQQRGIYQLMQYIGTGQTIADLERMFRLDEAFIKFLTVRLRQDPATVPAQMVETGGRAEERPSRDDRGPRDLAGRPRNVRHHIRADSAGAEPAGRHSGVHPFGPRA